MKSQRENEQPTKYQLPRVRVAVAALAATLLGITIVAGVIPSAANDQENEQGSAISRLAGNWQLTIFGVTGCGFSSSLVKVTLDASGKGSAVSTYHTSGCGDIPPSGTTPFQIQSLKSDGSGTANLSCGPDCGWNLIIQVAPNREVFNLVDVDPVNPGNYIQGTAVRQRTSKSEFAAH